MIASDRLQVKICGLTSIEAAHHAAECGADAVGLVFFPKSPRNLSDTQAKDIRRSLPPEIKAVGVFVDPTLETVLRKTEFCGLDVVQLHGKESPDLVAALREKGIAVVKALFDGGDPGLEVAGHYPASAFLVECAKGMLPGGNAMTWNWRDVGKFSQNFPLILAGGLDPENVRDAILAGRPDAVDVSSGVESSPGVKDPAKVKRFIESVRRFRAETTFRSTPLRKIF